MTIYCLCVDPERGKYLAFTDEVDMRQATSYTSKCEAIGLLVADCQGITLTQVIMVEV